MRLQELQQREVEILLLSCSGASLGFSFLALLVSAVFFWGFPCFPAPAFSPALPPSITLSIRPPASPPSIPPPISEGEWLEDTEPSKKHQRSCMIRNKKKRQGYKNCDKTTPAASFVPRGILRVTFNHFCSARRLARLSFLIFNICLNVCFFTRHAQRPHSNIQELLQAFIFILADGLFINAPPSFHRLSSSSPPLSHSSPSLPSCLSLSSFPFILYISSSLPLLYYISQL